MSVGTPYTRTSIDSQAGACASELRKVIAHIEQFKSWLDTIDPATLISLGYTSQEKDTLISSFSTIDGFGKLAAVYHGQACAGINFEVPATRLSGPA